MMSDRFAITANRAMAAHYRALSFWARAYGQIALAIEFDLEACRLTTAAEILERETNA